LLRVLSVREISVKPPCHASNVPNPYSRVPIRGLAERASRGSIVAVRAAMGAPRGRRDGGKPRNPLTLAEFRCNFYVFPRSQIRRAGFLAVDQL